MRGSESPPVHYAQVDGRIMPACGFNMFHRGAAKGPETPIPRWGKKPFTTDPPRPLSAGDRQTRFALGGAMLGQGDP